MKVFIDTAAWIALINSDDDLHPSARGIMADLMQREVELVTTEYVLLEVADAFSAPCDRPKTIQVINSSRQQSFITVHPVTSSLFVRGWQLFQQRLDKGWGLTDCTSFVVMRDEGILQAFTSDRHFEQAGFIRLMQAN